MKFTKAKATLCALSLALAACGGGGSGGGNNGGGGGGGGTANTPPSFTNSNDISFVESTTSTDTRTVVQLSATDVDGDPVTFDFVAGKDAALFSFVGAAGAVGFNDPVSFETPRDANGDNVYEVDVSVSDGTATTRQTLTITVTNDRENLLVTEVANGLGQNGHVEYIDDTNELLVVSRNGQVSTVDAQTGAVTNHGVLFSGAAEIEDMVTDGNFTGSGRFFVAFYEGSKLTLSSIRLSDLSERRLWLREGREFFASLGRRGNNILLGLFDNGNFAQSPSIPAGSITEFQFFGNGTDPFATVNLVPRGWGVRSPRLLTSTNLQGWVIDQGASFNELNQADFELGQADANFEWPYRDGLTDVQTPPATYPGTFVSPVLVQEVDTDGAGRWVDASDSLQGDTWFGVVVIADTRSNIWTWDRNNDGPLENRNLDFWGDVPEADRPRIVSMDDGDIDVGNAIPIYMLGFDGTLYSIDLNP
ncbi:hypothetical protein [Aurantiacibacter sp. MUD61]|uniref:hypothetical protein n=1 Tax=Aurantiacibacter sp. MUD61 TaxID=3009083 RepID=UPI0022F0A50F|nr:hypothetical protein [Aurantiacibacter sp. MUD61]